MVSFSVDTFLDVQPEDYESVDSWPVESKLVIVPPPRAASSQLKVKKENKNGKEWFFNIKLVSFT